MIKKEDIEKIIKAGSLAPSGSNSQPWKFFVKDGVVTVYALYEKDHPILNYRNRGTLIAHGALLENIEIAAKEHGYIAHTRLGSLKKNSALSEIQFIEGETKRQALYPAIFKRAINRKPYKNKPLLREEKNELLSILEGRDKNKVRLIENRTSISPLSKAASVSERIMFENKALHKLLFEEIVWTEKEEKQKKEGLFLKTMELNGVQRLVLKALKNWNATRIANMLGFSKLLAAGNAKVYASVAALGIILTPDDDESFIEAGRIIERLWLQATRMGLNFHILTGVPFLWQGVFLGESDEFSEKHVKLIKDSYETIKSKGGVLGDEIPVVMFRVGRGEGPSARSSKKDPEIIFG